jgi:hypothetical protein
LSLSPSLAVPERCLPIVAGVACDVGAPLGVNTREVVHAVARTWRHHCAVAKGQRHARGEGESVQHRLGWLRIVRTPIERHTTPHKWCNACMTTAVHDVKCSFFKLNITFFNFMEKNKRVGE